MANLDFFAAEADQRVLIEFLFASMDVRLFESYSEYSQELCEFRSLNELASAFQLGEDKHGNGHAILLQLWSPSVMRNPKVTRTALRPECCDGHTFRYCIGGGGLIQLYLGGVYEKHEKVVTKSHFGHFSEIGAGKWDLAGGVNWDALKTLSNKIQCHIRRRLAIAKVPGRPVLPQAFELARAGYALKEAAQTPWQYELEKAPPTKAAKGKRK